MIKITAQNYPAIEAVLRAANGNARAHTYTSGLEISSCAVRAEYLLEGIGLAKTHRPGATVVCESGGELAKAYDNSAIQTRVVLRRRSAGWYLDTAQRAPLYPGRAGRMSLELTSEQDAQIIKRVRSRYTIQPAEVAAA